MKALQTLSGKSVALTKSSFTTVYSPTVWYVSRASAKGAMNPRWARSAPGMHFRTKRNMRVSRSRPSMLARVWPSASEVSAS